MKKFAFLGVALFVALLVIAMVMAWNETQAVSAKPATTATVTYSCGGTNPDDACYLTFNDKAQYATYSTVVWTIAFAQKNYDHVVVTHHIG